MIPARLVETRGTAYRSVTCSHPCMGYGGHMIEGLGCLCINKIVESNQSKKDKIVLISIHAQIGLSVAKLRVGPASSARAIHSFATSRRRHLHSSTTYPIDTRVAYSYIPRRRTTTPRLRRTTNSQPQWRTGTTSPNTHFAQLPN